MYIQNQAKENILLSLQITKVPKEKKAENLIREMLNWKDIIVVFENLKKFRFIFFKIKQYYIFFCKINIFLFPLSQIN